MRQEVGLKVNTNGIRLGVGRSLAFGLIAASAAMADRFKGCTWNRSRME